MAVASLFNAGEVHSNGKKGVLCSVIACVFLLTTADAERELVQVAEDSNSCPASADDYGSGSDCFQQVSLIQIAMDMQTDRPVHRHAEDHLKQESFLRLQSETALDMAKGSDIAGLSHNRHGKVQVRSLLQMGLTDMRHIFKHIMIKGDASPSAALGSVAVAIVLAAISVSFYVYQVAKTTDVEHSDEAPATEKMLMRERIRDVRNKYKEKVVDESSTMGPKAFVINMFADLCAPGMLPLAYGMTGTGFVASGILLVVFMCVCIYTMWVIARLCFLSGQDNFADIWAQEIGPKSAWIPVSLVVCVCFGCCLSYSCFFADLFSGVLPSFGLPLDRTACLLIFTIFPTMPLCLKKDLAALAPSSFFALIAVIYTTYVMVQRAADGSYAPGGRFYATATQPNCCVRVSDHLWKFGIPSLVLVNNLAMGFLSHYNGCKYYRELENHTPTSLVVVTSTGMGISAAVFAVVGFCGYLTFGDHSEGVILNNYAQDDWPINIARLGVGFSIIAAFPLMMSGLREAVFALLKHIDPSKEETYEHVAAQDAVTLALIAMITGAAAVLTDAGLVVGVVGAVCGIGIIYIVPCFLYGKTLTNAGAEIHQKEIAFVYCLSAFGCFLSVAGLLTSLEVLG